MIEEWKEVYFKGVYTGRKISNLGRMMFDDGTIAKLSDNGAGYLSYGVCNYKNDQGEWRAKREYAHRLVAQHFLPNPDNLPQVNHKDCDKSNNAVNNLEWCKRGDNIDHAHAMGRMKNRTENADIDILEVSQVIELYVSVKRDGAGISETARYMDLPRTTASSIMNKRSRAKITDAIDAYLLTNEVVYGRLPTLEELGFNSNSKLVNVRDRPSSRNKSGVPGVCKVTKKDIDYWLCTWRDMASKVKTKVFCIDKFGDEEAFNMACEHRQSMMEMLYKMEAA